jgi:hypothetical protein
MKFSRKMQSEAYFQDSFFEPLSEFSQRKTLFRGRIHCSAEKKQTFEKKTFLSVFYLLESMPQLFMLSQKIHEK